MQKSFRFIVGLVLGLACGCSETAGKVSTNPVSGQILYDGKPAAGVQVYLYPTSAPGVPLVPLQPHGSTDLQGYFKLSTYGNNDGAAEGGYQVVLFWPKEKQDVLEESDEDRLLGWYTPVHTKLSVEIKSGDNKLPTWKLPLLKAAPKTGGEGIPGRN